MVTSNFNTGMTPPGLAARPAKFVDIPATRGNPRVANEPEGLNVTPRKRCYVISLSRYEVEAVFEPTSVVP
jgi:hypothetical protein